MKAKISDHKGEWFNLWLEDRQWIQNIMLQNMLDDLNAGYDPEGHSIRKQRVDLEEYEIQTNRQIELFKTMDDTAVDRWCYYDMKKRGAID